ncbi:hypothetical protein [Pseudomonas sp. ANT_H12B]|uniref:hypothetical protein n=1 Tax=Pseudomonas sp. ANT_H12B TaxID=2597348 RepID=UPI0015B3A63A|nr:hypothetical protein [Pseudomonas sp. ANT_H12B]
MEQQPNSKPTVLEQRRAMVESGEFQRELVSHLLTPQTTEMIGAFLKSPVVQQIAALQKTMVGTAIRHMLKPEVQVSFQAVIQSIGSVALSPQIGDVIRGARELSRAVEKLADSPLAEYLASGRSPDIACLVDGAGVATVSVKATGDARVIRGGLPELELELERQIVRQLESGNAVGAD